MLSEREKYIIERTFVRSLTALKETSKDCGVAPLKIIDTMLHSRFREPLFSATEDDLRENGFADPA
jgi:hypothetical protein